MKRKESSQVQVSVAKPATEVKQLKTLTEFELMSVNAGHWSEWSRWT